MRIDGDRPWFDLMTSGATGALPRGGKDRMALTDAGRAFFPPWRVPEGMAVVVGASVPSHASIQHADR